MCVPARPAQLGQGNRARLDNQPVRRFQVAAALENSTVVLEGVADSIRHRHRLGEPPGRSSESIGFGGKAYTTMKKPRRGHDR